MRTTSRKTHGCLVPLFNHLSTLVSIQQSKLRDALIRILSNALQKHLEAINKSPDGAGVKEIHVVTQDGDQLFPGLNHPQRQIKLARLVLRPRRSELQSAERD